MWNLFILVSRLAVLESKLKVIFAELRLVPKGLGVGIRLVDCGLRFRPLSRIFPKIRLAESCFG